jgi:hypothetical protein
MRTAIALLCSIFGVAAVEASDVNVGVSISGEIQPGVYGRVDIGNVPPPVYYPEPVVIVQPPRPVAVAPVYMHVPPGHARNWRKFCHRYDACGVPVYFVRSEEYEPGYRPHKERKHGHGHRGHD